MGKAPTGGIPGTPGSGIPDTGSIMGAPPIQGGTIKPRPLPDILQLFQENIYITNDKNKTYFLLFAFLDKVKQMDLTFSFKLPQLE